MVSSPTILLHNPQPLNTSSVTLFESIVEYLGNHPVRPNYVFLPVSLSNNWKEQLPILAAPGSVLLSSGYVDDWTLLEACAEHSVHHLQPTRDAQHLKSLLFRLNYAAFKTNTVIIPSADALSIAVDLTTQALGPSQTTRSIKTTIETNPSSVLDVFNIAWESCVALRSWNKNSRVLLNDGSTFKVLWDLEDRPLATNCLTAPCNSVINYLSQRHAGLTYEYKEIWAIRDPLANTLVFGISFIVSILSLLISPPTNLYHPLSTPIRLKTESTSSDSSSDTLLLDIPSQSRSSQDSQTAIVLLEGSGSGTGGVLTPSAGLGSRGGLLLRQRLEERGGWTWK